MNPALRLDLHNMLRYSELLLEPEEKKLPFAEWLDRYNIAKEGQLKYILRKCINRIDTLDTSLLIEQIETDCVYEQCDLLAQALTRDDVTPQLILDWLFNQITSETFDLTKVKCKNHCVCSIYKLGIALIDKGIKWPNHLTFKLLKTVNKQQRCTLNSYLDLIRTSIESNIEDYFYTENLFRGLFGKFKPQNYLPLDDGTIDDKPEIIFNGISDCLLLRKFLLNHLLILTRLDVNLFLVGSIDYMLMEIEELVSKSIHWSHHPLVDLYIEHDTMLLKCLHAVVEIQGSIVRNELAAHQIIQSFVDSINHDTGIIIDWLSSDSEVAQLTLKLFLRYFKLPNHKEKCTPMGKIFFTQLLSKIQSLWKNGVFPYNPSALLKYQDKFA